MVLIAVGMQPVRVVEMSEGQEVSVFGRLDVNTVAEVRLALHKILDRGVGDLLIHLVEAEVHDATGLGVIVGVHHRARRLERRLVLVDVSPRLDRLLRASHLHRVLARGPGGDVVTMVPMRQAGVPVTDSVVQVSEIVVPVTEAVELLNGTVVPLGEPVVPFTP
jgi:anti-anti-sigma factor